MTDYKFYYILLNLKFLGFLGETIFFMYYMHFLYFFYPPSYIALTNKHMRTIEGASHITNNMAGEATSAIEL